MSSLISSEVWKHAPRDVQGIDRMVLARLADSAQDELRVSFVNVERLVREIAESEEAILQSLTWLKDRGMIETRSAEPWVYPFVGAYITERDSWTEA